MKLFAVFCTPDLINNTIEIIQKEYDILYGKIFILESNDSFENIITFNVNEGNIGSMLPGSILVHRKKETNSIYTLNSLNLLIESLNGGKRDNSFIIPWENYRNSFLLNNENKLRILKTKIKNIIHLDH